MFNNEIMMQGERLKKYRINMLGVTQGAISEGVCTKTMISLIENNKQKLNFKLAHAISENLNRIAKDKGLTLSLVTPGELMENEDKQSNYIFKNQILNELKEIKVLDLFEQKLLEAEELIEKYNIADNKKIELYKLAADFYYYKHSYSKSDQMCDIGLKISINSKNVFEEVNFFIYKSRNNIFTENYVKALQQLDYAEKLNNDIGNNELSIMIFYHKGLTYKKLGKYDSALKYFKILKQFEIKDYKMFLKVKMVYANCLNEHHKFDEAEKEYKQTLSIAMQCDDKDFIAQTYRNLSELYFNQKDYKLSSTYIKESLIYGLNNEYRNESLYFGAKVLQNLNEDVEQYLLEALEICERKDRENSNLIKNIINELLLIYMKREDEKNIELIVEKAKELHINCYLIYAQLIKYYRYRNEEKSTYFNDKLINKLK